MECHFILTLLMPKGIFNGVSDRWKFLIHIDRQQMVKGAIYKRLILKMFSVKKKCQQPNGKQCLLIQPASSLHQKVKSNHICFRQIRRYTFF